MKKITVAMLVISMLLVNLTVAQVHANEAKIDLQEDSIESNSAAAPALAENAVSAIVIDAESGTVIFEKNSHQKLPPASITKIMTMLLVMEAIDQGKLKLTDMVSTSERAASMGGSQIFLEVGEQMTVEKC